MAHPEREIDLSPGEPGGNVDEKLLNEKSCIRFMICDDQGRAVSISYFSRKVSPEEISSSLNEYANDLEDDPPVGVSPRLIEKLITLFRKHARKVPGLNRDEK